MNWNSKEAVFEEGNAPRKQPSFSGGVNKANSGVKIEQRGRFDERWKENHSAFFEIESEEYHEEKGRSRSRLLLIYYIEDRDSMMVCV